MKVLLVTDRLRPGAPPQTATSVRLVRQDGDQVDLAAAMAHLRRERGARALLCEGAARLHPQIAGGLLDELFITQAPKLGDLQAAGCGLPESRRA